MEPTAAEQRHILIIDSDGETCQLLEIMFRLKGYATTVAQSGLEGLECLERRPPDAIVMEKMIADLDGWEVFQRVRERLEVPVMFLTTQEWGDYAAEAIRLGMSDYVRKPFYAEEVLARLEAILRYARRHLQRSFGGAIPWTCEQRPSVSVILPTLNEADNLPYVLTSLPLQWVDEVILVDGHSQDRTVAVARRYLPDIKVLEEPKPGKGAAIRKGYQASEGEIVVVADADGSHDPREIPRFLEALREGADFVKGSRFAHGGGTTDMPRLRQVGNQCFVHMVNLLFNVRFTDVCYGYHAFWRYCLEAIDLEEVDGFEIDTAIYLQAVRSRLKIVEVPSFEGHRFRGIGKLRTFPDGQRVLRTILKEYRLWLTAKPKELYIGFRGEIPQKGKEDPSKVISKE